MITYESQLFQVIERSKFLIDAVNVLDYFLKNADYFKYSNDELMNNVDRDISCLNSLKNQFTKELNKCREVLIEITEEQIMKDQENVSKTNDGN